MRDGFDRKDIRKYTSIQDWDCELFFWPRASMKEQDEWTKTSVLHGVLACVVHTVGGAYSHGSGYISLGVRHIQQQELMVYSINWHIPPGVISSWPPPGDTTPGGIF